MVGWGLGFVMGGAEGEVGGDGGMSPGFTPPASICWMRAEIWAGLCSLLTR